MNNSTHINNGYPRRGYRPYTRPPYRYGGTYYEKSDKGYTVVPPTAGTIVEQLPEGAKEEKVGDQIFMKLGEVYYQPIKKDGKDMYEVVNVEKDDSK